MPWSHERAVCLQYVRHVLSAESGTNSTALSVRSVYHQSTSFFSNLFDMFRIHQLLSSAEQSLNQISDSELLDGGSSSTIPWTRVLILLASHRIAALTAWERVDLDSRGNDVYYDPSCCGRFELPAQWVRGMSDTLLSGQRSYSLLGLVGGFCLYVRYTCESP